MERQFYLLAYDIGSDKRRRKIARLCEAVAERVQGSLFEAYLTRPELDKLLQKSARWLNEQEDSLRVYRLCEGCRERILTRGQGRPTPPPGAAIV